MPWTTAFSVTDERRSLDCEKGKFRICRSSMTEFSDKFCTETLHREFACGNYNSSACARVSDGVRMLVRRSVGAPTAHACAGNGSHHSEDISPGRGGPPGEFFGSFVGAVARRCDWRPAAEEPLRLDA